MAPRAYIDTPGRQVRRADEKMVEMGHLHPIFVVVPAIYHGVTALSSSHWVELIEDVVDALFTTRGILDESSYVSWGSDCTSTGSLVRDPAGYKMVRAS